MTWSKNRWIASSPSSSIQTPQYSQLLHLLPSDQSPNPTPYFIYNTMYFSPATIAVVAGVLASPLAASASPVEARAIEARTVSLWSQRYYGASGVPWDSDSTPGAWCGGNKPANTKAWKNLPKWDGGDSTRCSTSTWTLWGWLTGQNSLKVCKGGNKGTLPRGCRPPHSGNHGNHGGSATSAAAAPSAPANGTLPNASNAASASPSAAAPAGPDPNPTLDPVCQGTFQVQYADYKIVAPNGYWMGQTVGSATQDGSYMTYTLADTVDQCLKACDDIEGCVFVNTYYDTNDEEAYLPKHAPGVLTCAMFSTCVSSDKNDNFGGQDDPNQIYQSNGYCKSGACS